ncbi:MAG: exodeoxyribonuclease VII large subunit [Elusimicrobiota bacterium]|nr:MAG: exodeoxyribonuclease VII large subunit [Elusimicrobiota bacterium]
METARRVLTISELNSEVHDLLESSFSELWVEGEISNCKAYPSGHTYLSLKDEKAQVRAVLFKGSSFGVKFKFADGLKILARGRVTSYEARGELQFVISAAEPRSVGALQLALEQLKAKLKAEGLFDQERKKPLPPYPKSVGVVTSGQGAAVRDVIHVLSRRWPGLDIRVWPVKVQGPGAAADIAGAIAGFNELAPDTDVLLVGRGGGSIEDLWAFNEEPVARAIAASSIPVISCVGHETDTTIADFVADLRAPTPSAAAEMAVMEKSAVMDRIVELADAAEQAVRGELDGLAKRLAYAAAHPFLLDPRRMWEQRVMRVGDLAGRLPEALKRRLQTLSLRLGAAAGRLDAISPLAVLARGYAIATSKGRVLTSAKQVKTGDAVTVRLSEGEINCEVS